MKSKSWEIRGNWPDGGNPGLPAGITTAVCDGPPDPLADSSADELWQRCAGFGRQALAERFVRNRGDLLRDLLLDLPEHTANPRQREAELGRALWQLWIEHRDSGLEDLHRRGDLIPE